MQLEEYFVLAVVGLLGLSLLVILYESFRRSSAKVKLLWLSVALAAITAVLLLAEAPGTFR